MVRRIGTSAAAGQLQLAARPTRHKWSADAICRPITNCAAAPPARSAHQVGSSWWPRAVGGAEPEVGALMGVGGSAGRPGRATLTKLASNTIFQYIRRASLGCPAGQLRRGRPHPSEPPPRPLRPPTATGWTQSAGLTALVGLHHNF